MHRRYDHANIPIEVLRTFIAVNEASGNFSRAAQALGLTQPAVSAQIKRLQQIIGKALLEKTVDGTRLTEQGSTVLVHARRIVETNDQLLLRSRPQQAPDQLRIGMPRWLRKRILVPLIEACNAAHREGRLGFVCDSVERLTHDLCAGRIDLALLNDVATPPGLIFDEWWEQLHWVKSPRLALQPGEPLPLICWPGTASERHTTRALSDAGIDFFNAFSAPDLTSRVAAAGAGLGVMILSTSRIPPNLEPIVDSSFPTLPAMRKGIYLRQSLDLTLVEPVARTFADIVKGSALTNVVSAKAKNAVHPPVSRTAKSAAAGVRRASK